jgi:hypothetical protein
LAANNRGALGFAPAAPVRGRALRIKINDCRDKTSLVSRKAYLNGRSGFTHASLLADDRNGFHEGDLSRIILKLFAEHARNCVHC